MDPEIATTTGVPNIMQNIIELPAEAKLPAVAAALPVMKDDPFAPKTLAEAMALAEMMSKSTIVPKDYVDKPGNCFIAMQWGAELGLKPLQAMQSIAIINQRPMIWGDAVLAIVRSAKDSAGNKILEGISETLDETTWTATCSVKRRGAALPCVRTFSRADAVKAGLSNRDTWKAYEKRMLQMRARSWALRDEFTDVLRGMPIAEEVLDFVDREKDVTPAPAATPEPSKADRLKAKLKGEPKGPLAPEVAKMFDAATTTEKVIEVVDLARGFTDPADKELLNAAYHRAKDRLEPKKATETMVDGGTAAATVA